MHLGDRRVKSGCAISAMVVVLIALLISQFYAITQAAISPWEHANVTRLSGGVGHTCAVQSAAAYCWGLNTNGQLGNNSTTQSQMPVVVDTSGVLSGKTVTDISAGTSHTCVVASGAAYCWGLNTNGQLGNNSTTQSLVPVAVTSTGVLSGKTVTAISAGASHTCAVASGAAYCWGLNTNGRLGNNSTAQSLVPVTVTSTGVLSGKTVTAVAAGNAHTCVIATNAAYCWGLNTNGQLGNNSTTQSLVPVTVTSTGVLSGKTVTAIDLGDAHTCVIATNAAYCWGLNTNGQLGNNSTAQSLVPVTVSTASGLASKTIEGITTGASHTCIVAPSATAPLTYCWGLNGNGQLGNNSTTQSLVSVAVDTGGVLGTKRPDVIAAGGGHSCVVADNNVYCWGLNGNGQLGNNSTTQSLVPVWAARSDNSITTSATRVFANADSIQPGSPLAAINQAASLSMAGQAFRVRTGILSGQTLLSDSVSEVGIGSDVMCTRNGTTVYCWGPSNASGQLGHGVRGGMLTPYPIDTSGVLAGKTITSLSYTNNYGCVVASGAAYCWGLNTNGQLGNNSTTHSFVPVAVDTSGVLAGKTVTEVATGTSHTCVVASGAAYCWGLNTNGRLGNNSTTQSLVPVAVDASGVLAGKTVTDISAGAEQVCAIASGGAYCWGAGLYGRLGNNTNTDSWVPVAVDASGVLAGKTVTDISSTRLSYSCAVASGAAYCWGRGLNGRLGNNTNTDSWVPVAVDASGVLAGKTVTRIATGGDGTTCVVASSAAYCWGDATEGTLGNNSTTETWVPVAVDASGVLAGKTVTDIFPAVTTTCAVASSGLYCWGLNSATVGGQINGRLGNNSTTQAMLPVKIPYIYPAVRLNANDNTFTLKFAQKTAVTCQAQSTGFADVTTTSLIAWNTNPGVTNGASISSVGGDPTLALNTVYQTYVSGGTTFTNTVDIPGGNYALWDFSLKDNGAPANTTYCLKVTYGNGGNIESYASYPEFTTASAGVSVGFVDSVGTPVLNPVFPMPTKYVSTTCQSANTTLGSATTSRLRITQVGTAGNGWNVSFAPLNGTVSLWSRSDAGSYYDFNDASGSPAGCNSGSDGDGYAGQLTLGLGATTLAPQSGCSTSGLSIGNTSTAFSDPSVSTITLLSAATNAQSNCYWDVYDTTISQMIPAAQAQGTYDLVLTATVVAQ